MRITLPDDAMLKKMAELDPVAYAGARWPKVSLEAHKGQYLVTKNSSGRYDLVRDYSLYQIEAPDGHHFEAVAKESDGLRIYLCKDE